jgi:hypothetical protein
MSNAACPYASVHLGVEQVLLHENTCYVILVDVVIQTLICSDGWSSVSVREEV